MRGGAMVAGVVTVGLLAMPGSTQVRRVGNPYQTEFSFELGAPLNLGVNVEGVQVDQVILEPLETVVSGRDIPCEVRVVGANTGDRRVGVDVVLLLENERRRPVERITLSTFRPRPGRAFEERQRFRIPGASFRTAAVVSVFIEVS